MSFDADCASMTLVVQHGFLFSQGRSVAQFTGFALRFAWLLKRGPSPCTFSVAVGVMMHLLCPQSSTRPSPTMMNSTHGSKRSTLDASTHRVATSWTSPSLPHFFAL